MKVSVVRRLSAVVLAVSTWGGLSAAQAASAISYTYTDTGQLASVDGPRADVSDVTRFAYDAQGHLTQVTNALGQVTTLGDFDAFGHPQSLTDPNGVETRLTYTPQGWLASVTTAGATTGYAYNAVGDLTQLTWGDGSSLSYSYDDARRLIGIANNVGERLDYTLNALGNRTRAELKDSGGTLVRQQQRTYDQLGRLLSIVGAAGQVTHYQYDRTDLLTGATDANGHARSQAFDGLKRVVQVTDPLGGISSRAFDTHNRLSQVKDERGVLTQYRYDAEGHLSEQESPDSGLTRFSYDEAGNVVQRTDARGVVTTYTYDALNRLTQRHYPATPAFDTTFSYDEQGDGNVGIGHLTRVQDASGDTRYRYDNQGRLINEQRTLNIQRNVTSTLSYGYDAAGRLISLGYPSGLGVRYSRNAAGQVTAVTGSLNGEEASLVSQIAYLPFGPLKQLTWANGASLVRTYDQDYRLTAQRVGPWQHQFSYDAAGNLTEQQNSLWGTVQYRYDAADRLTQEQSSSLQKDYTYDAGGNRTARTTQDLASGQSQQQTLSYASDSNRLDQEDGVSLSYDAAGNLEQGGNGLTYRYDPLGRLQSVYQAGSQKVAEYMYDAFGQRVVKLVFDPASGALQGGTTYLYGPDGELLGQNDYSAQGDWSLQRHWVWLDQLPVAQVEQRRGQALSVLYLHPDHLGAPRVASNERGIVWTWNSDAFGLGAPNEDPDGDGQVTEVPLRLPGQLWDSQTQLAYNYYRDYDANLGRYIQSDPIGLRGGANTYAYVAGNPLNGIDPLGLATSVTIWQPVGWGESSFGHVSTDINGTTYSFGPSGMSVMPTADYVARNGFRNGTAVGLKLPPQQEAAIQACMSNSQGRYSVIGNNCGSPIQNCLKQVGVDTGNQTLPVSLGNRLLDMGNIDRIIEYPASRTGGGRSAPWAK